PPLARAPRIRARWEIDLSPGARTRPRRGPPGRAFNPEPDMGDARPLGQAVPTRGFSFDSGPGPWQGGRRSRHRYRGRPLASSELGAKQICPACSTKFYDLNRRPAHCPKCATEFDPEEAMRNRRVRARAVLPEDDQVEEKPPVVEEAEDGFEAEPDEAPELDEAVPDEPI